MSSSFDFDYLEGLEAVAHLGNVLGVLPVGALISSPVEESIIDTLDCRDHAESYAGDCDIEFFCKVSSLRGKEAHGRNSITSKRRKVYGAETARVPQKLSRNPNTLRHWPSLAIGLLRKVFGDGLLSRRRTHMLRANKQQDRKRYLAQCGLEEPEIMPRYERWLRSPFVEEYREVSRRRQAFQLRHGCKWQCEGNVDQPSKFVVHAKTEEHSHKDEECARCGCSAEFDKYGDRVCWCDSCFNGCQRAASANVVKTCASTLESPSGWALLVSRLLHVHDKDPIVSRKQLRARRLEPSAASLRHWARLHDVDMGKILASKQRASLFHQPPPHELTLSFQQNQWQAIEKKRGSNHIHRCWGRMLMGLHASYRRQCRRAALRDFNTMRAQVEVKECCRDEWISQGWRCNKCGRGCSQPDSWRVDGEGNGGASSLTSAIADEETLAAQLGLDVATYRMLRQLEQRDIVPEDYDLLGRLDEAVKPKTLTVEALGRYMTKTYMASSRNVSNTTLPCFNNFGASYWQLPLPDLEDDSQELTLKSTSYGVDFWKIQDLKFEDARSASTVASEHDQDELTNDGSVEVCGVCLMEFDDGDEMRVLPCAHFFHRDCIDHWLLHSATMCPTCKWELLEDE